MIDIKFKWRIFSCSFPFWIQKRKIFQSILLSRLDSRLLNTAHNKAVTEVLQCVQNCIKQNKLWYPSKDIEYIMFNAIWNAAFGSDLPSQSEIQHKVTDFINRGLAQAAIDIGMMQLGLSNLSLIKAFAYTGKEFCDYIETLIYEKLGYDEQIWDMKDSKWTKHFQGVLDDKDSCLISNTTQNAAEYGVVLLAKYPKYQSVIYNELCSVFGSDWKMEHTLSVFMKQCMRLANVLPIGIPHRNKKDIWTKDKKYI
eukprot:856738_1